MTDAPLDLDVLEDVAAAAQRWPTARLVESRALTKRARMMLPRSWRDRLLSWPWRPWIGEVERGIEVPDLNVYYLAETMTLVCHPSVAPLLRRELTLTNYFGPPAEGLQ